MIMTLRTDQVECHPGPGTRDVHGLLTTISQGFELLHEEVGVLVHDRFLIAEGTSAEGVRQGLPLLGVFGGIPDANNVRLVQVIPLVLEKALLAVLDVAIDITVGLGGGKGQSVGTHSDNVTLGLPSVASFFFE